MNHTVQVFTHPSAFWVAGELHWGVLILDVRSAQEFERNHVPGSSHLPLDRVARRANLIRERAAGRRVALISHDGQDAEAACELLHEQGLTRVEVVAGGILAWRKANLPLAERAHGSVALQARLLMGTTALCSLLLGLFANSAWLALSSLSITALIIEGVRDVSLLAPVLSILPWNRRKRDFDLEHSAVTSSASRTDSPEPRRLSA